MVPDSGYLSRTRLRTWSWKVQNLIYTYSRRCPLFSIQSYSSSSSGVPAGRGGRAARAAPARRRRRHAARRRLGAQTETHLTHALAHLPSLLLTL